MITEEIRIANNFSYDGMISCGTNHFECVQTYKRMRHQSIANEASPVMNFCALLKEDYGVSVSRNPIRIECHQMMGRQSRHSSSATAHFIVCFFILKCSDQ